VNSRRIITLGFAIIFLAVIGGSAYFFHQTYQEYAKLKQQESSNKRRLAEAEERLREQERYLTRLRSDPVFVEKIVRRTLKYARPDELVFRFED
jgi:cell division protein DivIC